jgi:acetoin utilization protein AcuB
MRVVEIMTKNVLSVPPTMPASEAWDLMQREHVHHLVVGTGSNVLGVFSAHDAGGRRGGNLRLQRNVGDLMTAPAYSVSPDVTVRKLANLLRGRTIGCVPVIDGKRLVGIVTVSDLLELLGRGVDRPAPPPRRGLHHRVPHRKMKAAFGVW